MITSTRLGGVNRVIIVASAAMAYRRVGNGNSTAARNQSKASEQQRRKSGDNRVAIDIGVTWRFA